MKLPESTRKRARIEIIPLIDIMFFLLATFVIVSMSMTKNKGISLNLPRAASGAAQERSEQEIVLSVSEEGETFWNKERLGGDEIRARLTELPPETPIFLRGDQHTHFHHIVTLLDLTRKSGVTKVAIETEVASEDHGS